MIWTTLWLGVAAADPVGVLFLGDSGNASPEQLAVSSAMTTWCATERCDMALTLGDNIYPDGVTSAEDPQWAEKFEAPYGDLDVVFHPSLGNHDHRGNPDAQVEYSALSERWDMPGRTYRFEASGGDYRVAFYALDTSAWGREQRRWLQQSLAAESADWVIVYGHHPVRSNGRHGDSKALIRQLEPLLADHADLYIAGHEHDKQVLTGPDRVTYVVAGSGGANLRPTTPGEGTLFAESSHGFGHLLITDEGLHLRLVSVDGTIDYETSLLGVDHP